MGWGQTPWTMPWGYVEPPTHPWNQSWSSPQDWSHLPWNPMNFPWTQNQQSQQYGQRWGQQYPSYQGQQRYQQPNQNMLPAPNQNFQGRLPPQQNQPVKQPPLPAQPVANPNNIRQAAPIYGVESEETAAVHVLDCSNIQLHSGKVLPDPAPPEIEEILEKTQTKMSTILKVILRA